MFNRRLFLLPRLICVGALASVLYAESKAADLPPRIRTAAPPAPEITDPGIGVARPVRRREIGVTPAFVPIPPITDPGTPSGLLRKRPDPITDPGTPGRAPPVASPAR